MRALLFLTVLCGAATRLPAQSPRQIQSVAIQALPIVANRFGLWLNEQYVGTLGWTMTSGDSHYNASATLQGGRVHCSVTARSPEGTFATTGPGLLEIELGLDPDSDPEPGTPPVPPGSKMYIIRAACPHPRSPTPREPRWSDEYSSYKQVGGEIDVTVTASGMVVRSIPNQFKGQWQETSPEETRSMNWHLCHKDWVCPGMP
jgi:hypothetical protein